MITKKQLENRKNYVGSSDVAAILGLSPWATTFDVWLSKTSKLDEVKHTSEAMEDGNLLESVVLRWASKELGAIEKRPAMLEAKYQELPIVSHPDGIVKSDGTPVEVKTAGMRGALQGNWGEAGTDEIPEQYLVQATVHMICMKSELCHVPAWVGHRGRIMYRVNRNPDLVSLILERVDAFWKLVKSDTPPEGWPTYEVARMIRRQEGKRIALPASPVATWRELEAKAKEAKDAADQAKAAVLAIMGDAQIGESEGGVVTVTRQKRKAYTVPESETTVVRFKEIK